MTCDKCQTEFYSLLHEEEQTIDGVKVIQTYLQCPSCEHKYVVCYDTDATLALKKQIRKCVASLKEKKESQYYNELKKIKKKQKRLERESKLLQTKYEGQFMRKDGES